MTVSHSKSQPLERMRIWPHRSLSNTGFKILICVIACLLITIGVGFSLAGAWPVLGFLGLELLIIWGAFKLNYRSAKVYETIETTTETLKIDHINELGEATITEFPLGWLRVDLHPSVIPSHSDRYQQRVVVSSHGIQTEVGAFLHPNEKASLSYEIEGMVNRSRTTRNKFKEP